MDIDLRFSKTYRNYEIQRKTCLKHELRTTVIRDGVVLPFQRQHGMVYGLGGVLDNSGRFVQESAFSLPINQTPVIDWGGAYPFDKNKVCRSEERVIFGGFINNMEWGHFLTDWSTRLWYAAGKDTGSRILFCQRGRAELHPNIQRLMELAGIGRDRILFLREGDEAAGFSEIVIPEESLNCRGYTEEYPLFFQGIAEQVRKSAPTVPVYRKLYLTRRFLVPRKEYGEEELEQIFTENGFHSLAPEKLSVDEQIFLMMNCDELVSLEGTAAHNILFARPGTRLIVLEKYEIPNLRQFVLDECAKIHAVYVGAYPEVRFQSRDTEGPFLVGLTEEAKAFFTASGMKFDESSINLKQRRENEKHYVSEWRVKPWKQLVRKVTGRIAECGRRH